jgi:hypothetical protein
MRANMKKEYTGTVYLGVVGPELELGLARESIERIARREGDSKFIWARGTKGIETRGLHFKKFLESHHDFLFMIDGDMSFPQDILERLRGHKLPYVSGIYMRRQFDPIAPIWYKPFRSWPLEVYLDFPDLEEGKLLELGGSGWGCVLIHREVIEAVQGILHGEELIAEHPMDVWPYDLQAIMRAIRSIRTIVDTTPSQDILIPALEKHLETLESQIRPLRVDKSHVGSDLRFPFYARVAGYKLMGDPFAECGHFINYPLAFSDFMNVDKEIRDKMCTETGKMVRKAKRDMKQRIEEVTNG